MGHIFLDQEKPEARVSLLGKPAYYFCLFLQMGKRRKRVRGREFFVAVPRLETKTKMKKNRFIERGPETVQSALGPDPRIGIKM